MTKRPTRLSLEQAVIRAAMRFHKAYGEWYQTRHDLGLLVSGEKSYPLIRACQRLAKSRRKS